MLLWLPVSALISVKTWSGLFAVQLEDVDVTVADHVQKVLKANFGAAWDEVGDEYQLEDTYALSTVETLQGMLPNYTEKS